MGHVELPSYLLSRLHCDRAFACRLVDVELADGRIYRRLHLAEHRYLTGECEAPGGDERLPFSSFDIANVQRHAFAFGRLGAF